LRLSIKVTVLSLILAVDLAYFLFFPTYLQDIYNQIFPTLPWTDNFEFAVILIVGLIIATIVSILLIRIIMNSLFKSIQRGNNDE
jgi:hypothetical protein